jgi:hypothetical protein
MCCASEAQFRAENNEITWKSLGKAPLLHRKMAHQADPDDLVGSPLRISDGAAVDPWGTSVIGSGQLKPNGNRR